MLAVQSHLYAIGLQISEKPKRVSSSFLLGSCGSALLVVGILAMPGLNVIPSFPAELAYGCILGGSIAIAISSVASFLLLKQPSSPRAPYEITQEQIAAFHEGSFEEMRSISSPIGFYHYGVGGKMDHGYGCMARNLQTVLHALGRDVNFDTIHAGIRTGDKKQSEFGRAKKAKKFMNQHEVAFISFHALQDERGPGVECQKQPFHQMEKKIPFWTFYKSEKERFQALLSHIFDLTAEKNFVPFLLSTFGASYLVLGVKRLRNGGAVFWIGDPHVTGQRTQLLLTLDRQGKQVSRPNAPTDAFFPGRPPPNLHFFKQNRALSLLATHLSVRWSRLLSQE